MKKILKKWLQIPLIIGLLSTAYSQTSIKEKTQPESITPTPRQTSEWWQTRHEEKVKEIQQGDIDLLMIGDSITHSWEKGGKEVWENFYRSRKAANIGFSGDRTQHVIWRLQNGEIDGISPKLAVIMIGTNNTGHRDPSEDTALGIKHILKELRTRLPETKILLLAIFPRSATTDDELRKLNDATNEIISNFSDDEHVFYLDINNAFLDEEGNLSKDIMPDFLHPNANGYQSWATAMEPMIQKLIGETN
jgi:beta-glucosidase